MKKKHNKSKYIPKKQKKFNPLEGKVFTGKMDISRQGMGFLIVDNLEQDILIYPEHLKSALNGDTVRVKVTRTGGKGRPEGEVVEVLEHAQTEFIGRLQLSEKFAFLIPDQKNMRMDIFVPLHKLKGGKEGEHAVVRIQEWQGKNKNPVGAVVELLTHERQNEIAMKEILVENGFPLQFSAPALQEAGKLPDALDEAEIKRRKDCRDILTFTIDPADAKDFDDALSFRKLRNGNFEVGVHIADVSHYVQPGTQLNEEAYGRATSVYFPDRVLPMLPEHISNTLCSLRPNEDKFTFSVIFQLDKAGNVKQFWIGRTVIHSNRRFSYEEAQSVIENKKGDLAKEILTLHEIAQSLRADRFSKGAVNFSSQEIRFKLDEKGLPVGIIIKESKEANQLIEEFMLLANRTVAGYVGKKKINGQAIPFPYRIHDLPNEDKLAVFAAFASRFGYTFNLNDPDDVARSFNEMLQKIKGQPEEHILEQLGIRTMSKAAYSTENIGHYGLGFEDYCHFTSPIRRYPDIMVHRIVQECIDNTVKPDKEMEQKCRHCSNRERKAMEAERTANKYKQVEYMQQFIGEEFDALISGIASFGFWAETIEQKCEGLIPLSDLAGIDEFHFQESDYALVGLHTGKKFQMGDKVRIQVVATSLEKRQIDFTYVPVELKQPAKKKSAAKKKDTKSKASKGK
jgi:ribonuclease R